MARYREKIDDIFEALYGEKIDECGDKYGTDVYYHESLGMEQDFYDYLGCADLYTLPPSVEEMVKFIIFTEYMHIGNDHFVRNNLNISKLEQIALELLKEKRS